MEKVSIKGMYYWIKFFDGTSESANSKGNSVLMKDGSMKDIESLWSFHREVFHYGHKDEAKRSPAPTHQGGVIRLNHCDGDFVQWTYKGLSYEGLLYNNKLREFDTELYIKHTYDDGYDTVRYGRIDRDRMGWISVCNVHEI